MERGVPAGAKSAYHDATSTPRKPDSASVGTCGIREDRFGLVMAMARRRLLLTCCITPVIPPNIICASPDRIAITAGAVPLYGMCTMSVPVADLNNSAIRKRLVPAPAEA